MDFNCYECGKRVSSEVPDLTDYSGMTCAKCICPGCGAKRTDALLKSAEARLDRAEALVAAYRMKSCSRR